MKDITFYDWLGYVILGLAILNFLPDKVKPIVFVILILGGIYGIEKTGSFSNFVAILSNRTSTQYNNQGLPTNTATLV